MTVSLVLPCRNEEAHIVACLDSLVPQLGASDELIVVDGESDDGTLEIVARYMARDARIRLLKNPRRQTAAAMNIGVAAAVGDIIIRVDGHSVFPADYVRRLVWALDAYHADNVGAAWRVAPTAATRKAHAIARALAHPFAAGPARFRLGTREARSVDTVPFGCFRRSTLERVGPFREELPSNQDDEFNTRLRDRGGKIVLLPGLEITYFARATILDLWRTYFRYGHYKPLALRLAGRPATLRQFVPGVWLVALGAAVVWSVLARSNLPWLIAWGGYLSVTLAVAALDGWRQRSPAFGLWLAVACVVMHLAYAVGWWSGMPRTLR
jgi:glycosyltransferase involved in cell wall biosynthesis